MKIEQFVMAYGVEQDRLRAILPDGFVSLRPVLRINAEVRDDSVGYVEFNTAVEKDGNRGWLNIGSWNNVPFERNGKETILEPTSWKSHLRALELPDLVQRKKTMQDVTLAKN